VIGLALPITAITCDHGDASSPVIFPVTFLFSPCSELEEKSSSAHGIRICRPAGTETLKSPLLFSLLAGEFSMTHPKNHYFESTYFSLFTGIQERTSPVKKRMQENRGAAFCQRGFRVLLPWLQNT